MHIKTELGTLRLYRDGDTYIGRDSPIFSCTVHYIADNEVYLCNAVGVLNISLCRRIQGYFERKGISNIVYERKNKLKKLIA